MIQLKTEGEIEIIARGGAIIADLLNEMGERVQPGVTTADLDQFSDRFIRSYEGAVVVERHRAGVA